MRSWARHGRRTALVALLMLCGCPAAVAFASDFEHPASNDTSQQFTPPLAGMFTNVQRQDTPNDPNYDQAEPDTQQPPAKRSTNLYDERFDLFGFPSVYSAVSARYADSQQGHSAGNPQVSGYNAAGAWKLERGRGDVTIAILDTGIKWDDSGLRDKIHLNTGELPYPEHGNSSSCGAYDCNADGVINVEDYAQDPRVSLSYPGRTGPPGLITGQDLLHAFGDCRINASTHLEVSCGGAPVDNDHNGYANDIVGWNFFDNTNDPTDRSSYFAASNHGSGRASDAAEQGNDGAGSIGVCPHCQLMPVRVWDTFVSDGNTFGLGITYAADNGANVIEGADGSLYHSAFAEHASDYAYRRGVVQTYSGDDLNTGNHNYPANYGHAMLVQGTVPDSAGLGQNAPSPPSGTPPQFTAITSFLQHELQSFGIGTQIPPRTYFRGANTTQYGGKSSISMEGATGSINTGRASGAAGLVISAGLDHGVTLTPDETREILEQTAERVTTANTGGLGIADPGASPGLPLDEQWTTHFGWGRVNLGDAVSLAASGKIPPQTAIDAPDWFAPLTGASVEITGLAHARMATGGQFHWKLMWGAGLQPSSWTTVRQGDSNGTVNNFGSIDLNAVRSALASAAVAPDPGGPVFAPNSPNPYKQQFTVQLEVTGAGIPTMGIDRRVFTAFSDPTLRAGYPLRMGTGGEAPVRYADLNGDNVPELIVPTEDGSIHAYEPGGSELAGWPVHTQVQLAAQGHDGAPGVADAGAAGTPPREPPRGALIADLDGNGVPSVIDTAGIHLYVWNANGTPRHGFPVSSNLGFCGPSLEHQPNSHPKCGFLSSPAFAHLEGKSKPPDIVVPSLDGHLYAFHRDGTPVAHYPVALVDPHVAPASQVIAESINEPAIGDLTHSGHDDVVVATNETYGASNSGDVSFAGLLGGAGQSTRVYAIDGATGNFLPGWPISIGGLIQSTLPLIGPGNDPAIFTDQQRRPLVVASATSGSLATYDAGGKSVTTMRQEAYGPASNAVDRTPALNLFESAAIGKLLPSATPDVVKYEISLQAAANLLLVGQNQPYNHLIGAWNSANGAPEPSWPTITDDYQFLSSSTIAKLNQGSPANQVLAGTGLGLLHAYDGVSAQDAPGFPKVTGGWLFAPAALSVDGRIADITREGYLFEWKGAQSPCQTTGEQWPSFRHDPFQSGNFNTDGTPPAAPASVTLTGLGGGRYALRFLTPGDDGFCGNAARFFAAVDGRGVSAAAIGLGQPGPGGGHWSVTLTLPSGAKTFSFQALDGAGNVGSPATLKVPATGQTTTGGGLPVGVPALRCARASGRLHGRSLGPLRLGMTRTRARRLLHKYTTRGKRYMDFYCLAPGGGIRAGYPSRRLLRRLSRAQRRGVSDRIVLALTANHRYTAHGVRVGERIAAAARRLRFGAPYRIGLNNWYLATGRESTYVFKVRHGKIEELGLAERSLTRTRRAASLFLKSFY